MPCFKYAAAALLLIGPAAAQGGERLVIRAPFVRVEIGPDDEAGPRVMVDAAFVHLAIPLGYAGFIPSGRGRFERLPPREDSDLIPPVIEGVEDLPHPDGPQVDEGGDARPARGPNARRNGQGRLTGSLLQAESLPPPRPSPAEEPRGRVYVPTLREFAATFEPLPGDYEVWILHPRTRRPVRVSFSLPDRPLEEMDCDDDDLELEYDDLEVKIEFRRNGSVRVEYDD